MASGSSATTKSYHHGNLRDALVEAAEALIAERASWTFTLREVARAAGVSHNAPYNHFADRRALLAAVAARGFDRLARALDATVAAPDAVDALRAVRAAGETYVGFALANPSTYRLMFSAELAGYADERLEASGSAAFGILRDTIERGIASGAMRADAHGTHALAAWSLVHGLATLALDGRIVLPQEGAPVAALAAALCATLVAGLALPTGV